MAIEGECKLSIPFETMNTIKYFKSEVPIDKMEVSLAFKSKSGISRVYKIEIIDNKVVSVSRESTASKFFGALTNTDGGSTSSCIADHINTELEQMKTQLLAKGSLYKVEARAHKTQLIICTLDSEPALPVINDAFDWLKVSHLDYSESRPKLTLAIVFDFNIFGAKINDNHSFEILVKRDLYFFLDKRNFETIRKIRDNDHSVVIINESAFTNDKVVNLFRGEGINIATSSCIKNKGSSRGIPSKYEKSKKEKWIEKCSSLGNKLLIIEREESDFANSHNLRILGDKAPFEKLSSTE